jgi:hypothetical protein
MVNKALNILSVKQNYSPPLDTGEGTYQGNKDFDSTTDAGIKSRFGGFSKMKVNMQNKRENKARKASEASASTRKSTRVAKNKQQNIDQKASDAAFNKKHGIDLSSTSQRDKTKTDSYIKHHKPETDKAKAKENISKVVNNMKHIF